MLETIEKNTSFNVEIKKFTVSVNQIISAEKIKVSIENKFKFIKACRLIKKPNGDLYKMKDVAELLGIAPHKVANICKYFNTSFSNLPLKCSYCGKIFTPSTKGRGVQKLCSERCRKLNKSENTVKSNRENRKKYRPYEFKINNNIAYLRDEASNYLLNAKAQVYALKSCPMCGERHITVDYVRSEVYCGVCGFVYDGYSKY